MLVLSTSALPAQTLTVSGSPTLLINTAIAGAPPTAATGTATYDVRTTNTGGTYRIVASVDAALPAGVTLTIQLQAPTGATSTGEQTLSTVPVEVVTGIPSRTNNRNLTITYRLTASAAAGVVPLGTRTVTLRLQ